MAQAVERLARPKDYRRTGKCPRTAIPRRLRRIKLNECGHPIPDRKGEQGAARIAEIAREAGPRRFGDLPDLRRSLRAAAASRATGHAR